MSSEEQKLKEEIEKLKKKLEKCEAEHVELYGSYRERSYEALLRGDEKIIKYCEQCVRLI